MPPDELDLLQGTLDLLVLRALSFGPSHGYGVARFIRQGSGLAFRVLDGALYTSLHRLEARGAVAARWGLSDKGKRAKFYQLTAAGRRELRAQVDAWARYTGAVGQVMKATPQES
jgi:transcriptional regulator